MCEAKNVSRASVEQEGSVHVSPSRGVFGRGMEWIEGALGEIDVHDQYDQSSKNFQLAAPVPFFFSENGKVDGDFQSGEKKKRVPVKFLLDWSYWLSTSIWLVFALS